MAVMTLVLSLSNNLLAARRADDDASIGVADLGDRLG
jgi:hypothetical protein